MREKGKGGGEGGGWAGGWQRNRQVNVQALSKLPFSKPPFSFSPILHPGFPSWFSSFPWFPWFTVIQHSTLLFVAVWVALSFLSFLWFPSFLWRPPGSSCKPYVSSKTKGPGEKGAEGCWGNVQQPLVLPAPLLYCWAGLANQRFINAQTMSPKLRFFSHEKGKTAFSEKNPQQRPFSLSRVGKIASRRG